MATSNRRRFIAIFGREPRPDMNLEEFFYGPKKKVFFDSTKRQKLRKKQNDVKPN